MQQKQSCENEANQNNGEKTQTNAKTVWSVTETAIAIQIFLIGTFFLWFFITDYVQDRPEGAKLLIESMFSFAIVIVVIIHAVMYFKQAKAMDAQQEIMGTSLMISSSSQMDVDGIDIAEINRKQKIVLKIGNIGHVPADEIKVWVDVFFQVSDKYKKPLGAARKKYQKGYFWDFGSSKLFPGKLRLKLFVPIEEHFSEELQVPSGEARIIAQIRIANKDGFGRWESQFAFRRDPEGSGWVIYPVRSVESLLGDLYENNQPTYYEPK